MFFTPLIMFFFRSLPAESRIKYQYTKNNGQYRFNNLLSQHERIQQQR